MASEVTQAHVETKQSQPFLCLTGGAIREASPRPGLANGPAACWGSQFTALQAAHAYGSVPPSPLGVRGSGSSAAQQVGLAVPSPLTRDCGRSAGVEGRAEGPTCLLWAGPGAETLGSHLGSVAPGAVSWKRAKALAWGCAFGLCLNLGPGVQDWWLPRVEQ